MAAVMRLWAVGRASKGPKLTLRVRAAQRRAHLVGRGAHPELSPMAGAATAAVVAAAAVAAAAAVVAALLEEAVSVQLTPSVRTSPGDSGRGGRPGKLEMGERK